VRGLIFGRDGGNLLSSDTDTTIGNLERLEMVMGEWLGAQLAGGVLVRLHKVGMIRLIVIYFPGLCISGNR